jgi:hypothetical protein
MNSDQIDFLKSNNLKNFISFYLFVFFKCRTNLYGFHVGRRAFSSRWTTKVSLYTTFIVLIIIRLKSVCVCVCVCSWETYGRRLSWGVEAFPVALPFVYTMKNPSYNKKFKGFFFLFFFVSLSLL